MCPGSLGFAAYQGNSHLFGSLGIEDNLLFTNPILCFPLSLSLSYSDSLLSFALVILIPSQAYILTPLWDPSLETRKLTWVGLHSQIWSPHPGRILFYFWDFFSIGVVFIFVHLLGRVVVTMRYLIQAFSTTVECWRRLVLKV